MNCEGCKHFRLDYWKYPCSECKRIQRGIRDYFTPEEDYVSCENCKHLLTDECEYPCSDCNMLNTLYEHNHFTPKEEEEEMNCEDRIIQDHFAPMEEIEMELKMESSENVMSPPPESISKPKPDNVNHPSHYEDKCSLECIEAMDLIFGLQYVYCFCLCNAWKYIWRYKNKNGTEDLEKARWYIDRAKWYEANRGDEIYYPNKILHAMDDWLLEHDIV